VQGNPVTVERIDQLVERTRDRARLGGGQAGKSGAQGGDKPAGGIGDALRGLLKR